jgi:hypothetical protein
MAGLCRGDQQHGNTLVVRSICRNEPAGLFQGETKPLIAAANETPPAKNGIRHRPRERFDRKSGHDDVPVGVIFEDLIYITPILHYFIGQRVMGSLKKRRKAKINKHKRRKKLRLNRHKKRTWQK